MSERDPSRKMQPTRRLRTQTSLIDVLTTAAEESKTRAETIVGSNEPRRQARFMDELLDVTRTLATIWGVDPRRIPVQESRTIQVVYQRLPTTPKKLPTSEVIRQRTSSDDSHLDNLNEVDTTEQSQPTTKTYSVELSQLETESIIDSLSRLPLYRGIALLRSKKGLSQQLLADLVGVSKSMVDKMERGIRNIKPGLIHDICTQLGLEQESDIRKILIEKALENERVRIQIAQTRRRERDGF